MSKSTLNFKETKLVDYCDRRDGTVETSEKGTDPTEKWTLTYSNGEVLSSNFGFFVEEELEKCYIKSFVLDDSDEKWIHETMKLSGEEGEDLSERVEELKPVLKSLTDFVFECHKPIFFQGTPKQKTTYLLATLYIREVWITSGNPSERRRFFTEEVLEIIPIILKQQNSRTEEWNDLLQKYHIEWKRKHVHYSINMETFNSVLEEFNINKALITLVPDPFYEISEEDMQEFGNEIAMRDSPDGTWLLDSSHAIFLTFQNVVWGVNWKENECKIHENCKGEMKKMIIEVMRQFLNTPQGELIPIIYIDESIEWLRNQCSITMGSNGQCLNTDTSISIDTWPDSHSLDIQVYKLAVHIYGLPNYHSASYFTDNSSFDSQSSHISVWMTRVRLLTGWAQQFFDEKSVELANVILVLILKKVPVEWKNSIVSLLKTVQASIAGLDYTHSSEEQLNCTAEREDFVSEALSKPKEVEGPERAKKEKKFGNVPNVFSLLTSTEEFVENEAVIEKKDDLLTTSESRKEEEDVTATEEKDELKIEDVKALKKEVERLKAFEEKVQREQNESKIQIFEEKSTIIIADLENKLKTYEEVVQTMSDTAEDINKENKELTLKLMTLEEQRDSDIKEMENEKQELKVLLEEKARKVDDVEKKMKLKDSEMHKMRSELKELNGLKKQSEDQEKWRHKKNSIIERLKSEAEKSKSNISEKEAEIVRLNNELAKSTETSESLVLQLSRLEEEMRMLRIEEQERSAMTLKANEQLQTTIRHLSIQNEEQQKTIQNLYGRLAMTPSPPVSTKEDKPESVLLMLSTIRKLCDQLSISADIEDPHQSRFTLQRLRNIKDRFQNKDQLKLARTMTDKLIQMSNRSEIRELAVYEYQQYEANFQNYTQLVDLNIEKMKETRDCSLYSPLPKPPAFSDRFMNEYWLQCDKKKKELEMDISDSECLICFFEMNSDQKTLKCDHCNKITHLKCASKWLQIHRSCPHCRREQLDPDEFPALS